ncbi:MAG: hypothetical protein IJ467_02175, partial [Bacteroidaceae bacterium]|nr:hypothetical protein [Bacteroidaceae bacterium]
MKHSSLLHSFILFSFSFFTLCAISGCSKSEDDEINNNNISSDIIGLWYEEGMNSADKDFTIYHFKDNGTLIEYYAITSTGYYADSYTYRQNNKSLKITDDWGETEAYEIKSLSSSKLILFDIAYEEELVFVRYNGNIPNGTQHNGNQGSEDNWNDNN